jgi:hypothetical protein
VVVVAGLHSQTGWPVAAIGLIPGVVMVVAQLLLVLGIIDFGINGPVVTAAFVLVIVWMVVASLVAPGAIGRGPSLFAFVNAGLLVVAMVGFAFFGGLKVRSWQDFYSNYLLLGSGVLAGLTLVVGIPAWTVLFGLRPT